MTAVAAEPAIDPEERVARNIRLARSVANRHARRLPFPRDEDGLFGECLVGLLVAARLFDPDRGFAFATYACPIMHKRAAKFVTAERRRGLRCRGLGQGDKRPEVYTEADYRVATPPIHKLAAPEARTTWSPEEWAAVLRPLSERNRGVVLARYVEGLTVTEIAKRIGRTFQRVEQILERVHEILRHKHPRLAAEL